ncbi:hypothetical protein FHY11_000989 [Xanthomonas arboricola]|nr:hypothetical protein [Xanthomonas euroxanthea]
MHSFHRLSVGTRLSALLTLVIALSLGLLALTIYRQSAADIASQVKAELRSSTRLMQQSVAMYDVTLTEGTQRLGSVFDDMLPRGARELDTASTVTIGAQNTPTLRSGTQVQNLNFDRWIVLRRPPAALRPSSRAPARTSCASPPRYATSRTNA